MRNIKITVFTLLFFIPLIMMADGAKNLFEQANTAYEAEDYDSTISLLDSLISVGLESSELYYNLGNAWFKKNEVPHAILYYEKASKIDPNNPDLIYNLELANTKIADRIEPLPEFFLKKWWSSTLMFFSESQWMVINIIMYSLLLGFFVVFFISNSKSIKQITFYLGIIFLVFSLLTGFMGYERNRILHEHNTAIVFTPTINVKSSPNENANTIFVIHQGTKVELIDQLKDWYRIKLANGSIGWMKGSEFSKI